MGMFEDLQRVMKELDMPVPWRNINAELEVSDVCPADKYFIIPPFVKTEPIIVLMPPSLRKWIQQNEPSLTDDELARYIAWKATTNTKGQS